jgi:hypothetical protein
MGSNYIPDGRSMMHKGSGSGREDSYVAVPLMDDPPGFSIPDAADV